MLSSDIVKRSKRLGYSERIAPVVVVCEVLCIDFGQWQNRTFVEGCENSLRRLWCTSCSDWHASAKFIFSLSSLKGRVSSFACRYKYRKVAYAAELHRAICPCARTPRAVRIRAPVPIAILWKRADARRCHNEPRASGNAGAHAVHNANAADAYHAAASLVTRGRM